MNNLTLLWFIFIASVAIPVRDVIVNSVTLYSLLAYILSIVLSWRLLLHYPLPKPKLLSDEWLFLFIITILHILSLAFLSSIPHHFHFDEFIVANTSIHLPALTHINWFGVFPEEWVAQFPVLFHILQKPFFIAGPSLWATRISTWPYSIGILWYLYLLSRLISNRSVAKIAVVLHALFAPTLYINSMGLHFISSELFYLGAITHFFYLLKTRAYTHLFPLALMTTASYLTYTSSYSIAPVIMILIAGTILFAKRNTVPITAKITKALLVAFILFLPFLTFHIYHIPFLTLRSDQVNIFNGTWGDVNDKLASGTSAKTIVIKQSLTALRSLIIPDMGGHGGYDYGKQPLFHNLGFTLFTIGFFTLFMYMKRLGKNISLGILTVILVPFILGFILTIHPPPFHRISIIYPFISLLTALPIWYITEFLHSYVGKKSNLFTMFILLLYSVYSFFHVSAMIQNDRNVVTWDTPRIADYIQKNIAPNTTIYIAAYPTFHYVYELPFRLGNTYPIVEEHKLPLLENYTGTGPLIINRPTDEDIQLVANKLPDILIIRELEQTALRDVVLLVPASLLR